MGTEPLWPSATAAVRGSMLLGIWGRAEGALHSWDFFLEGRHARDLPTPKTQRYGPLVLDNFQVHISAPCGRAWKL